jgi:hypothetical protein
MGKKKTLNEASTDPALKVVDLKQLDEEGIIILVKTADGKTEEFHLYNYGEEKPKKQPGIGISVYESSCIYENEDSSKTLEIEAHLYGTPDDPKGFTLTGNVLSFSYDN